jgi:hypothetical protein
MWVRILGQVARHQQTDHEVSHMAYLLDIFERIPVHVTHDRADLTGNNMDETYKNRPYASHDPNDPASIYHPSYSKARHNDLDQLTAYMKHLGMDTSWWENVKSGKNEEPFIKLAMNDPTVAGRQYAAKLKQQEEEQKAATSKKKEKSKV